jgi:hypothetical protein
MSVAFVREESAEAAHEVSLPLRAISAHPNLVTQSGLRGLEHALTGSRQALKAAQAIADANDRRRGRVSSHPKLDRGMPPPVFLQKTSM